MTCEEVMRLVRLPPDKVGSLPSVPGVLFLFNSRSELLWSIPAGDVRAQIECVKEHGCTMEVWQNLLVAGQISFRAFSFKPCANLSDATALSQLVIERCKPVAQTVVHKR